MKCAPSFRSNLESHFYLENLFQILLAIKKSTSKSHKQIKGSMYDTHMLCAPKSGQGQVSH